MEPQELLGHLLMAGLLHPDGQRILSGLMNSSMKGSQGNVSNVPPPPVDRPTVHSLRKAQLDVPVLHEPDTVGKEDFKAGRRRDPNAPSIWGDSNWGQHKWEQKNRELSPSTPSSPPAGYQGSGSLNPFNDPFSTPSMPPPGYQGSGSLNPFTNNPFSETSGEEAGLMANMLLFFLTKGKSRGFLAPDVPEIFDPPPVAPPDLLWGTHRWGTSNWEEQQKGEKK